ncbi:hypothetical protein [Litoribrevibacter albus]|uniref:Sulfotransferase family protein n=1 Tax=Litoribrevibacter albus TaxID=1473156 RepID=A0AA37S8B6_9GAMM|nr:hypothetical protein [Litoribrevibacter albus]GLQ30241.1 hypothetical protein GCM10007876_07190 [Litoribrevibacter albus]
MNNQLTDHQQRTVYMEELSNPGWVPFDLVEIDHSIWVDWRFIGETRLLEPRFEVTVRRHAPTVHTPTVHTPTVHTPTVHTPTVHTPSIHTPFNAAPRSFLTGIEALDDSPSGDILPLAGIIFHASRCGSTLLSQLFATSSRLSVLSEPPIIESLIDWSSRQGGYHLKRLTARLGNAIAYLTRCRRKGEERSLLKVESQQILDQPLFKSLYPEVPWIFLYREPEAILFSQFCQRGRQMVPGMINPTRLDRQPSEIDPAKLDDYCALVTEKTFSAALDSLAESGKNTVHYKQLPDYAWQKANQLFSVGLTQEDIESMRQRCQFNSKSSSLQFSGGTSQKVMPEFLKKLARGKLKDMYLQLNSASN